MQSSSLEHFIRYLQVEKSYSPHTIYHYKNDIEQFQSFMKQHSLKCYAAVSYVHVRLYLTELYASHLKRKTIARKISSLRSFYRYLMREEVITENPFSLASIPKQDSRLPQFLYEDELKELFTISDLTTPLGQRNQALLELLYGTGIRVQECCDLKVSDIDFTIGTILVFGKGRKERYIPLGTYALHAIRTYLNNGREQLLSKNLGNEYLFLNYRGGKLTPRGVRKILNELVAKSSSVSHLHPHMLRHTFATDLLNNGADMRSVQELLGHSHLSSTQIYTHVTKDHLKHVHNRFHPRA